LLDSFKGLAAAEIKDGKTCLFWDDLWLNKVPRIHYLELYSFARVKDMTVHMALNAEEPEFIFHFPLSPIAAQQLVEIAESLESLPASDDTDIWTYIWGSPLFSTSKSYDCACCTLDVEETLSHLFLTCSFAQVC